MKNPKRNSPIAILNAERQHLEARIAILVLTLLGGCACDVIALYIVWRWM